MAMIESQLDSTLSQMKSPDSDVEDSSPRDGSVEESPVKKAAVEPNGSMYGLDKGPGVLPLSVDYRSPVSHFIPPVVEMYKRTKPELTDTDSNAAESSQSPTAGSPVKRKRGRPRVDKTSPEYLAKSVARKQAKMTERSVSNSNHSPDSGEKRKRGRPRVDKTSPDYLARKRAKEIEALERKAKKEYKRRTTAAKIITKTTVTTSSRIAKKTQALLQTKNTKKVLLAKKRKIQQQQQQKHVAATKNVRKITEKKVIIRRNAKFVKRKDSAASSSAGDTTPKIKRKYTKRAPGSKNDGSPGGERIKGKRGRPRKTDQMGGMKTQQQGKIRVRSNLMPINAEPISVDSDDSAGLASPGRASDSLSLDENLRALRHIHEKYANIDKDDLYEAHLLAANFKKPVQDQRGNRDDDDVLSIRSSEGRGSVKELDTRVEKLEDSSGSNSDSSSSGSGSSSSSSSSSSSGSSSSSDSSDSESEDTPVVSQPSIQDNDSRSFGAWSATSNAQSGSDSDEPSEPREPNDHGEPQRSDNDDISESDNESPDKSFQCHMCRKWYSTRVTLKIHRRVHQNRSSNVSRSRSRCNDRYECDCCNETFNRREKLYNHKATVHRGSMTVRCEVCRKCFEDETELAAHDSTHTEDERQGRCSECSATFTRYDNLRRHRLSAHAAHQHACAACGKRFTHAHSLQRHQHNHARQLYRCVVCKASFARADQLAQHLNSHLANYKRLKP